MRNHRDGSTGPRVPTEPTTSDKGEAKASNAFAPEYLDLLNQRDEPPNAREAETAGPWHMEETPDGRYAVLRYGESLDQGDVPFAVFADPVPAKILLGAYPGIGRRRRYELGKDDDGQGYPLTYDGDLVGHLRVFDEDAVLALNVVDPMIRVPLDFAWVLDAAGAVVLVHTGRICMARAAGKEDAG